MTVNGIIAEYNPFHNGHQQHLQCAKERNHADYTIIAMSGSFVQRGAPALLDKYSRARMALTCGADLVLELPACYSASSAEYFATGAVTLLDKLGVVTNLCFGSECGDHDVLLQIAGILLEEPEEYRTALQSFLKQGQSYPSARTWALLQYDPSLSAYKDILSMPNNILGIEYMKALLRRSSRIRPDTSLRIGSDYHDKRLGDNQSSALAIRQAIFSRHDYEFLESQMPGNAYRIMSDALKRACYIGSDDFSGILLYKLLSGRQEGYTQYLDVSEELSDRICNHLCHFGSFEHFCDLLKTKDMTYTRVSRSLLHILLDIKKETLERYRSLDYIPYARVLGFRRSAAPLLAAIKENSSIPLVTKLADAEKQLEPPALDMLREELRISEIYFAVASIKAQQTMQNEYSTPIVILE